MLVFAPHPDDTSICAGGTAALLAHHNKVISVVMTVGHRAKIEKLSKQERIELRKKEAAEEAKILNVDFEFLDLELYNAGTITANDSKIVMSVLEKYRPEIVLLPNMQDPHPTHALCRDLVLRQAQSFTAMHATTVELWHYESPWSLFGREEFNVIVSLDESVFAQKMKAIRAHKSQNARTRYDTIASSLGQMRAAIVGEQDLAGYGGEAVLLDPYVELFSVIHVGSRAKLIETVSGIRGVFRKGLTPEVARDYGYAYGSWLKTTLDVNPKVIVAMDTRTSGPQLKRALIEGLNRAHCHIFDVGIATTPMAQFEVRNRKCEGGIIVTASHNEPEWNGFKFLWGDGSALAPEQMQEVINSYHAETKEPERPYVEHYLKYLSQWIGEKTVTAIRDANLKAVVDPNGGAIVVVMKKLFDLLGIETIALNVQAGKFAHTIEPTFQSLKHLAPLVKEHKADFGVAWDCDGDRLEIMLPNGELLSGHTILALLVDQILGKLPPKQTVVINAATSGVVAAVASKYDARVVETDVGEANVVRQMKIANAAVGGEGANGGGIIPPSRCRDGMMTLLKILEMMVEKKKGLLQLLKGYPKYYTRQANMSLDLSKMDIIRKELKKNLSDAEMQVMGDHGGTKFKLKESGTVWFRESRTERNIVRLLVDTPCKEATDAVFNNAVQILEKWGSPLQSLTKK